MFGMSSDATKRQDDELAQARQPRRDIVIDELRHRIANIFTVVRSIVRLTADHYDNVTLYQQTLIDRLRVLEETHNLLARELSECASIEELIRIELAPYETGARVSLSCPPLSLFGGAAESFAMILHELATNSVKHGALGEPAGRIAIRWSEHGAQDELREVTFEWHEMMKRRLGIIDRYGYGASIIGLTGSPIIGHSASLEPTDSGLRYRLVIPCDRLINADETANGGSGPTAVGSATS